MIDFNSLPDKIRVLGETWPILYFDEWKDVDITGKEPELFGKFCGKEHQIRVFRGNLPIETIWKALLHELMHLWIQDTFFEQIGGKWEERFVCSMANFFTSLIRDN
jgi:hypothetical protein